MTRKSFIAVFTALVLGVIVGCKDDCCKVCKCNCGCDCCKSGKCECKAGKKCCDKCTC